MISGCNGKQKGIHAAPRRKGISLPFRRGTGAPLERGPEGDGEATAALRAIEREGVVEPEDRVEDVDPQPHAVAEERLAIDERILPLLALPDQVHILALPVLAPAELRLGDPRA